MVMRRSCILCCVARTTLRHQQSRHVSLEPGEAQARDTLARGAQTPDCARAPVLPEGTGGSDLQGCDTC